MASSSPPAAGSRDEPGSPSLSVLASSLSSKGHKLISLLKKTGGLSSPLCSSLYQEVVLSLNSLGMKYLSVKKLGEAKGYLDKASNLTSDPSIVSQTLCSSTTTTTTTTNNNNNNNNDSTSSSAPGSEAGVLCGASHSKGPTSIVGLRVLTLNNLSCYYKSMSDLTSARSHLLTAISLSRHNSAITSGEKAVSHSNMSAVLSAMDDHVGARKHAKIAVGYCKEDLKRFR